MKDLELGLKLDKIEKQLEWLRSRKEKKEADILAKKEEWLMHEEECLMHEEADKKQREEDEKKFRYYVILVFWVIFGIITFVMLCLLYFNASPNESNDFKITSLVFGSLFVGFIIFKKGHPFS